MNEKPQALPHEILFDAADRLSAQALRILGAMEEEKKRIEGSSASK